MRFITSALLLAVLTTSSMGTASAATIWDESMDGDLSGDPMAPTNVGALSPGSNVVIGTMTGNTVDTDIRDYLTFTVPAGYGLYELRQLQYLNANLTPGNTGFHALDDGPTSLIPGEGNIGTFLGSNHLDPLPVGTDMLPDLANAITGGSGFAIPLGPGTYTYLIQQTGIQRNLYTLDFVLRVPEPASAQLLVAAALPLAALRRRS